MMVHGNAAPKPCGAIASKKIMAPIAPILKIHPLNNMEIAMSAWQQLNLYYVAKLRIKKIVFLLHLFG
jgi:hypothetical protein